MKIVFKEFAVCPYCGKPLESLEDMQRCGTNPENYCGRCGEKLPSREALENVGVVSDKITQQACGIIKQMAAGGLSVNESRMVLNQLKTLLSSILIGSTELELLSDSVCRYKMRASGLIETPLSKRQQRLIKP